MKRKAILLLAFLFLFIIIDRGIGWSINKGLSKYYGLDLHSEILFIGHSQLMLAIDKKLIEDSLNCKVSKYCREGVDVVDRYQMIKQYLSSSYSDSLKVIVYGVDQFIFKNSGLSENSYMNFYPYIDELNIDSFIREKASTTDYWEHKLICSTRYSDALLNNSLRGWFCNWDNYKIGILDTITLRKQIIEKQERTIEFDEGLIRVFERTLNYIKSKNIKIILVQTPIAKMLNDYEPGLYQKIQNYFKEKANSSPLIEYWDMNPNISDKYDLFFDPIHLNPKGQQLTTESFFHLYKDHDFSHRPSIQ